MNNKIDLLRAKMSFLFKYSYATQVLTQKQYHRRVIS